MFIKYLFLFLALLTACSPSENSKKMTAEKAFRKERDKRIYSAVRKFKKAMEAKGYRAAGLGEGVASSSGKQNYLGMTFDIEQLPDVDFARRIEVEAIQEFLSYINAEEGIQDYVAEYPYPIKFIEIAFINKHSLQGLCSVANFENELIYRKDGPDGLMGPSVEAHRESYEDAVRILEHEQLHPVNPVPLSFVR